MESDVNSCKMLNHLKCINSTNNIGTLLKIKCLFLNKYLHYVPSNGSEFKKSYLL